MPIRITGMNSGLDTEALVSELVSAYRKKTEKYTKAQTKLTWKQDAWKSLSSKTYSFRTGLDKMRFSSNYKLKTTTVSNSTKASVTAGNNAVNGSQSLNITSLAKSGYLTGGVLKTKNGMAVTKDTKLSELDGFKAGKVNLNDKHIELKESDTINSILTQFNDAGVTASFDEKNQRIFINSKDSGEENDFNLSAMRQEGADALKALGLYTESKSTTEMYKEYNAFNEEWKNSNIPSRADWIQQKLEDYNKSAEIVTNGNQAKSYLERAAAYQAAKEKMQTIEAGIDQSKIPLNTAKKLLEDSGRFVGGSMVYTLAEQPDGEGRSYYTLDGNPNGDKYYLDTEVETVQAKNEDGSLKYDDQNQPVMEARVKMLFRTEAQLESGTGGFPVSTADDYLKEKGFTDETIEEYRSALAEVQRFDADVEAEKAAYTNRIDELTKQFLDGIENPDSQQQQEAADKALEQANAELKPEGIYKEWRSLETVQNMSAAEIEAAQKDIEEAQKGTDTQKGAEQFLSENAFFASYAREYAAATDDTTRITQTALAEEISEDFEYALKALEDKNADYNKDAVRISGEDATIYLNGAKFTSSSNTFSINGLTINALATTTTEDKIGTAEADATAVTITTATDNQGIYDKIKDFLGEYNNLINAMTGAYNAESAKEYEPLTDEEREAMTDSQIEKWEEKGKSGVLRRDTTLSSLMSTLTTAMSKSYEINGKKYSLSSFGIKTLGILNAEKNQQNAYHIDGDQDDEATAGKTDKLMAAIIEDPDAVTEFFQRLSTDLSTDLGKKMTSTTMRTYGTFYNDKEMAREYSDYTTTIAKWEQKLADIEESYYKKFAAMEKALATLQSQSSQLAGLLGG